MVCILILMHQDIGVFPTPVGVFPLYCRFQNWRFRLPHASGGVSSVAHNQYSRKLSSPRQWGCFLDVARKIMEGEVFPTPVGVFLKNDPAHVLCSCLPHASGGVSDSKRTER